MLIYWALHFKPLGSVFYALSHLVLCLCEAGNLSHFTAEWSFAQVKSKNIRARNVWMGGRKNKKHMKNLGKCLCLCMRKKRNQWDMEEDQESLGHNITDISSSFSPPPPCSSQFSIVALSLKRGTPRLQLMVPMGVNKDNCQKASSSS